MHVSPRIELGYHAPTRLTEGEVLSLPFKLINPVGGAPLAQLALRHCQPARGGEWTEVELGRTGLQAGGEYEVHIDLDPLPAGQQRLQLQLELLARLGGVEERYVFESAAYLRVAKEDARTINISNIQNIDASGANIGTGGNVVTQTGDTHNYGDVLAAMGERGSGSPVEVAPFQRHRSAEFAAGLRGYTSVPGMKSGRRMTRNVEVEYRNFQPEHYQSVRTPFLHESVLRCGRNNTTTFDPPNHLRLLQMDPRTGAVDRALSKLISGTHFELLIQDDRLQVRDRSSNGTWRNNKKLEQGSAEPLEHGDTLTVLNGLTPIPLKIHVGMHSESEFYSKVVLERR